MTRQEVADRMDELGDREVAGTLTLDEHVEMSHLIEQYPDIAAQGAGRPVDEGGPVA